MQDTLIQIPLQPFIRLVQSNTALLTRFAMSPEVIAETMSNAQSLLRQGQGSRVHLAPSNAFGELMQGLFQNYTDFLAELGQSGMAMLTQGQAAMMQKAHEQTGSFVPGSNTTRRRARRAA